MNSPIYQHWVPKKSSFTIHFSNTIRDEEKEIPPPRDIDIHPVPGMERCDWLLFSGRVCALCDNFAKRFSSQRS